MTDNRTSQARLQLRTRVIGTAVLMGIGGMLGLAAAAMAGSAFVAGLRRRLDQMEVPPSALARQNLARAKAATAAGVDAWRDGHPTAQPQAL